MLMVKNIFYYNLKFVTCLRIHDYTLKYIYIQACVLSVVHILNSYF